MHTHRDEALGEDCLVDQARNRLQHDVVAVVEKRSVEILGVVVKRRLVAGSHKQMR